MLSTQSAKLVQQTIGKLINDSVITLNVELETKDWEVKYIKHPPSKPLPSKKRTTKNFPQNK